MSKKSRETIKANLERAIAPSVPSQSSKRSSHLDGLLDEYAPLEEPKRPLSASSGDSLNSDLRLSPDARLSPDEPIKETHIKNTHKHRAAAAENTPLANSPAAVAVCVEEDSDPNKNRSRFTFAECKRYAESLRQEGITNPGGYATKIYRSGEADNLIEKFLAPSLRDPVINASLCPDCSGTGFYYPNGMSGGVAKCKHTKLKI